MAQDEWQIDRIGQRAVCSSLDFGAGTGVSFLITGHINTRCIVAYTYMHILNIIYVYIYEDVRLEGVDYHSDL